MSRSTWDIMIGRLRERPGKAWLTTTPKGFDWIYELFVTRELDGYELIRSSSKQNPYLPDDFIKTLEGTYAGQFRQQEIEGEFVQPEGALAQRHWFGVVDAAPADAKRVRFWDFAATEKKLSSDDPDYTAGARVAYSNGVYYIEDMIRQRLEPAALDALLLQTAQLDGLGVVVGLEQEPGASGKVMAAHQVKLLAGYTVKPSQPTGDKVTRAMPWLAQAQAGNVKLVRGRWNVDFLDEACIFPVGQHDDMVDAVSGAMSMLAQRRSPLVGAF